MGIPVPSGIRPPKCVSNFEVGWSLVGAQLTYSVDPFASRTADQECTPWDGSYPYDDVIPKTT